MKALRTSVSFLLLAAMGLFISPEELLHDLSHPEDMKDVPLYKIG